MHPFLFAYDPVSSVIPRSPSDIRNRLTTRDQIKPAKPQTYPQASRHSEEPKQHQESNYHTCQTHSKVTKNDLHKNKEPNRTSSHSHSIPFNQPTLFTYPALWIYSYLCLFKEEQST